MRRALDTGLVLLLAGGLALAGATAAFAGSAKASVASARVDFVGVRQDGREQRGQHFTAARVRILKIDVEWRTLVGAHIQRIELIMPDGSVYQRFTSEVRSHASKSSRSRPTRRLTASLDSGPPRSRGASAPRIRRVFVPARYTPRSASSTRSVRRA